MGVLFVFCFWGFLFGFFVVVLGRVSFFLAGCDESVFNPSTSEMQGDGSVGV